MAHYFGCAPGEVVRTMTPDQVGLYFEKVQKDKLRWVETQAGIIWAMASGKYKPKRKAKELTLDELKRMGVFTEE